MLKKLFFIVVVISGIAFGQFKDDPANNINIHEGVFNTNPSGFFLDFLNSENFEMKHSVDMSYSMSGKNGMALGVYTNSMSFKFSDDLKLQVDASLVNTPYNTFGDGFSKSINGIYLSRARLDYKISDQTKLSFEYRQLPAGYGNYNSYGRYNGFYNRGSMWDNLFSEE